MRRVRCIAQQEKNSSTKAHALNAPDKVEDGVIKNPFKDIPDCEFCHYAAGIFFMMSGPLQGKSICPDCEKLWIKLQTEQITRREQENQVLQDGDEPA